MTMIHGSLIPMLQIRQTFAQIGIDADLGTQSIRQPRAKLEIRTEPAKLTIEQPQGELVIDQSKAWDALAVGNHLEMMTRMREQGHEVVMETIAKIARQGDRMAMIHLKQDPIPEFAMQVRLQFYNKTFAGPASVNNVEFNYTPRRPVIDAADGSVHVQAEPSPVQYEYIRGKLEIYMKQYPSVEIIPPAIDAAI